jgi:hypothetical protein
METGRKKMDLVGRNRNNDSITVLAIKKLGDLQRQLMSNENRIVSLERESADYRQQFNRVNIITDSLKAQINRLNREQENLMKSFRAVCFVIKLMVRRGDKANYLKFLKIVLALLGSAFIQRMLFLDKLLMIIMPSKNRRVRLLSQVSLYGFLFLLVRDKIENLFKGF